MQQEKQCSECKQYFFYDDGLNPDGDGIEREGFCPTCVDPHFIPGESYYKDVIIEVFRKHLKGKGIAVHKLTREHLINMMGAFVRTHNLYHSNGTFTSVTLEHGTEFEGKEGRFQILLVHRKELIRDEFDIGRERFAYMREIKCCRCGRIVLCNRKQVLEYYLGLIEKACISCDPTYSDHERDCSGLNRNGSQKSELSDRAMAKALNVSRNDYRRYRPTEPVPSLPIGTVVNGLRIVASYWDEHPDSYSPKYKLECPKCKKTFTILQKSINSDLDHFC